MIHVPTLLPGVSSGDIKHQEINCVKFKCKHWAHFIYQKRIIHMIINVIVGCESSTSLMCHEPIAILISTL